MTAWVLVINKNKSRVDVNARVQLGDIRLQLVSTSVTVTVAPIVSLLAACVNRKPFYVDFKAGFRYAPMPSAAHNVP